MKDKASKSLLDYRAEIDKMPLNPSDRKKLLMLPLAMAKRSELPEPKKGQNEYELFSEITGTDWNSDATIRDDKEFKITEFDYENYFSEALIKSVDTDSPEFKDLVKMLNFTTQTEYEKLQARKEAFKGLMPVLAGLTKDEQRALLHKISNESSSGAVAG